MSDLEDLEFGFWVVNVHLFRVQDPYCELSANARDELNQGCSVAPALESLILTKIKYLPNSNRSGLNRAHWAPIRAAQAFQAWGLQAVASLPLCWPDAQHAPFAQAVEKVKASLHLVLATGQLVLVMATVQVELLLATEPRCGTHQDVLQHCVVTKLEF